MGPKYKVVGSGNQAGIALDVNITTDFLSVVRLMAESIAEQYPCDHDCSETGDTSSKDSLECLHETASQFKEHDMLYS